MDSPVYLNDGFQALIKMLVALHVVGLNGHRISWQQTMIRGHIPYIDPSWIPLPIIDTSMHFMEIVPVRKRCQ